MSDTPASEPRGVDSTQSAEQSIASPPDAADTGVLLSDEADTADPRGLLPESEPALGIVLDLGEGGTYTLEQRLGRGGMGEVYKARQVGARGFSQLVAIKRLRPGLKRWAQRSFDDEARVLSLLHHENIARVYGFFETKGNPYLVMEYIEGCSLHSLLELARRKKHRFSESVACAVMAEVADALDYAHQVEDDAGRPLHIVHRDVSPTNILIAKTGRVVLVDFGVAFNTQEGRAVTSTGSEIIKGKAPYVSPEQVKYLPLDGRSGLFSVGTILVEMLTGEAPFGCDDLTLLRIGRVTPEYVASRLPHVSKPLRAICQELLAVHPDERFPTGSEVAEALRRHAGLGKGSQGIRVEVEKLQALPNAKAPPPAVEAALRSLSELKRARRVVAVVGALLLAVLVLASWYVPRHIEPVPSPPLQVPAVSLQRSPEKAAGPALPVPPLPSHPAGKPKRESGPAVAARPLDPAPAERSAPAVVRADRKLRVPSVNAAPAGRQADGGGRHVSLDADGATSELVAAQSQLAAPSANYAEVSGEAPPVEQHAEHQAVTAIVNANDRMKRELEVARGQLAEAEEKAAMPDHAVAALLLSDRPALTSLVRVATRAADRGVRRAQLDVYLAPLQGETMVAVVVNLKNPRHEETWEPTGAVVKIEPPALRRLGEPVRWGPRIPAAVRSVPQRILPGQSARIAVVFDKADVDLDDGPVVVELLRNGKWEFEFELSPTDVHPPLKAGGIRWPQ